MTGLTASARSRIVEAATAATAEVGWESTSMQAVQRRAGVSNGSLFHHFPSRDLLAAAVVARGLEDHQRALARVLRDEADARRGVRGVVAAHLDWMDVHRAMAHLFLSTPSEVLRAGLDVDAVEDNRVFFTEVADWLHARGWDATVPLPVVLALWTGPAQEYARPRLTDPDAGLADAADALADGAWHALAPLLSPGVSR